MSDTPSPNKRPLPRAWSRNPFEAPTARVEDARRSLDDTLADDPNKLAAGRGFAWWGDGWRLFREATGRWIGIGVVLLISIVVLVRIPFIGNLTSLVLPVLGAGLMLGCRNLDSGGELTFGHLFAGFQNHLGRLLMVNVLYLLGTLAIGAAVGFGSGFVTAAAGMRDAGMLSGSLLLGVLVAALLFIPLMMSAWFAPALIVLHDLTALEAMKLSFRGCLRNILPSLVYSLAFIGLAILASLPIFLGWLALLPVIYCSIYASYRDIFTREY